MVWKCMYKLKSAASLMTILRIHRLWIWWTMLHKLYSQTVLLDSASWKMTLASGTLRLFTFKNVHIQDEWTKQLSLERKLLGTRSTTNVYEWWSDLSKMYTSTQRSLSWSSAVSSGAHCIWYQSFQGLLVLQSFLDSYFHIAIAPGHLRAGLSKVHQRFFMQFQTENMQRSLNGSVFAALQGFVAGLQRTISILRTKELRLSIFAAYGVLNILSILKESLEIPGVVIDSNMIFQTSNLIPLTC